MWGFQVSAAPGTVRDAIVSYLQVLGRDASATEVLSAVRLQLNDVSDSSVRSYLSLNCPRLFERTARGRYRLVTKTLREDQARFFSPIYSVEHADLFHADCFDWLASQEPNSVHAVVTDPPYGLVEYSDKEQQKLRSGVGGVWRMPPSYDGHRRSPLPRFTVLRKEDHDALEEFFSRLGTHLLRVLVPGSNLVIASNPLLAHIVCGSMSEVGFELRGTISRLVMTMRGGDRPKNAHEEFRDVSVMPRSMHEPWVVLRKPLEGRVQDNLRKWGTGGFRRISEDKPFGDVIKSSPTPVAEKRIAPHPSLKPQAFLRQIVRASLPLTEGTVLDPFAGSGSTLAAANACGYSSVGVEADKDYIEIAKSAIVRLGDLSV